MIDLISIIIPVYNVENYLENCIKSVIQQTYKKLEIILVDDGSTDKSGSICDEYKKMDKRIKAIHKINGGLSDARNCGIDIASGKYITFIDSDDYIDTNYIEYLYKLISVNDADLASCTYKFVDEKNNIISKSEKDSQVETVETKDKMKSFFRNKNFDTTAWGKLYKAELFINSDIRYPIGKYHEDVFTTYLLVDKAKRIVIGNEQLYNYRITPGSITQANFSVKHLDAIEGNEIRRDFIIKNYPECIKEASAGIIYSCNQVIVRMAKSNYYNESILMDIQVKYRKYIKDYITFDLASKKGKIFAFCCFISVKIMLKILGGKIK